MVSLSRSKYVGRIPEASCRRGTGAAPAGDGGRNLVPGPCSGSLAGHYEPARSDHGQRPKGKDAALVRRKARGVTLHAQGPAIRARPGATHSRAGLAKSRPCALSARQPLALRGSEKTGMRATPWPRAANRGRFSCDSTKMHSAVGWAKALARPCFTMKPLVRRAHQLSLCEQRGLWWARRTIVPSVWRGSASACAHPTIPRLVALAERTQCTPLCHFTTTRPSTPVRSVPM